VPKIITVGSNKKCVIFIGPQCIQFLDAGG